MYIYIISSQFHGQVSTSPWTHLGGGLVQLTVAGIHVAPGLGAPALVLGGRVATTVGHDKKRT